MAENEKQPTPPQPPPYMYKRQKKSRWWIPVLIVGIVVIFFFISIVAFFSMMGSFFEEEAVEVKENSVLALKLGANVQEYQKSNPFAIFGGEPAESYFDVLRAIKRAKNDPNIKGIYIEAGGTSMGFSKLMEYMDVIDDFKESGKFVYSYLDMGAESNYLKALPSDKIFIPHEGFLELNGFASTSLFFHTLLDTMGVDMMVIGFEDFKSAGEPFSRDNFSDSSKLQLRRILDQRFNILAEKISKYRDMPEEKARAILNEGRMVAFGLKEEGLITGHATETEVKRMVKAAAYGADEEDEDGSDKKLRLISVSNYLKSEFEQPEGLDFDNQIAIVYGVGAIAPEMNDSPFGGDEQMITPEDFIGNLKKARDNDKIKAIILRIDSPGGSALASDEIFLEIKRTAEEKPVYASMSDVAASGGYYMAIGADTIIAHSTTITGSIGVISIIPNFSEMLDKIYIKVDSVASNPAAAMLSGVYPYGEKEKQIIHSFSSEVYSRFLQKVADSRGMEKEDVRAVAKGRVWTGEDAKRIGLVDEIGGLYHSIDIAKKRIGIPEDQKTVIRTYPEKLDPMQAFLNLLGMGEGGDDNNMRANKAALLAKYMKNNNLQAAGIYESLPPGLQNQVAYLLGLISIGKQDKALMAMPYHIDIK